MRAWGGTWRRERFLRERVLQGRIFEGGVNIIFDGFGIAFLGCFLEFFLWLIFYKKKSVFVKWCFIYTRASLLEGWGRLRGSRCQAK